MYLYVTSTNALMGEPTHTARMLYLGQYVGDAEQAIDKPYQNYQQPEEKFPNQPLIYSALPFGTERELVQFYLCSEMWYSIERIGLETIISPSSISSSHVKTCKTYSFGTCDCGLSRRSITYES